MGSVGIDFPITDGLNAVWGYEPSVVQMRKLLDIFAFNPELATDELAELRYRASIRPGVHEAYSAMFPSPRQNGVSRLALTDREIRSIDKEVLLIHGRDDKVIPVANSIRLNRLIARSQLHVFGQCGHWVQLEQADRFTDLVAHFLLERTPAGVA
jgi:pimeloyl-ACP methyl ester carboxylesterase